MLICTEDSIPHVFCLKQAAYVPLNVYAYFYHIHLKKIADMNSMIAFLVHFVFGNRKERFDNLFKTQQSKLWNVENCNQFAI